MDWTQIKRRLAIGYRLTLQYAAHARRRWITLWRLALRWYGRYRPIIDDRARAYSALIRLHRPIGTLLLGWPVLWALWLAADGVPDARILCTFIVGVFIMRSAGCVINDYADRKIDPHVRRTRNRPLVTGWVSEREALILFIVLILIAFGLVLTLNQLTIYLSFVAVIAVASYPFMKRLTYLPQAFLGVTFGWAVPMAWAAQSGATPEECWLLFIVVVLWTVAYDTMYAMVDRDDDIKIGVRSTAILFGDADKAMIGLLQICVLLGLLMLGTRTAMGWPYYIGLCCAAGAGVYQQYLIRKREPAACERAFLNNNWFGMAVFAGIAAHYIVVAE